MAQQKRKRSAAQRKPGGAAWVVAGLLGAAAIGVAAFFAGRLSRRDDEEDGPTPAAFAVPVAERGSFNPTRNAGPEHMRDEDGDVWDEVDEGSDESFPASDPPSYALPKSRRS
ncbi:hypothetical protein [Sphingomonas sp.]|uniref:hypothetical protein n=1 Tax=Sphingomonas sp. TaxID=28214 RepID=UPI0025CFCF57|nr:hypothetical protein [Sphingomonas sp.]